jgi:Recombinase
VHDLLTNPVYTGAFVFGRTRTEKRIDAAGPVISRTVALPRDQWEVLIPGHHAGFIAADRAGCPQSPETPARCPSRRSALTSRQQVTPIGVTSFSDA